MVNAPDMEKCPRSLVFFRIMEQFPNNSAYYPSPFLSIKLLETNSIVNSMRTSRNK